MDLVCLLLKLSDFGIRQLIKKSGLLEISRVGDNLVGIGGVDKLKGYLDAKARIWRGQTTAYPPAAS